MHFNFDTSTVFWILTFAAVLVLLVVLLGRDRARRFPWFTTSMTLMALRMLAGRLLNHRISPVASAVIFLVLADLAAILALLVVIEIARRAFEGAERREWIAGTLALLAVGAVVLALWSPWPSLKTLFAGSELTSLRMMELVAQKLDLLSDVLIVQLGLLVMVFGRYFKAGWHSHVQQLCIGLFMASLSQLAVRGTLQHIASQVTIHSQDEYKRVMGLMSSLNNANSIIFIVVIVWWIVCLWIDEPGTENREQGTGTGEQEAETGA